MTTITRRSHSLSGFLEWFQHFSSRLSSVPGNNQSSLQSSEAKSPDCNTKSTLSNEGSNGQSGTEVRMTIDLPEAIRAEGSSNVVVNRFDLSDRTMASLAFGIAMFALGIAVLGLILGQISERESRLAQQDAMLLKAALIAHKIPINEDQLHKEDK